MTCHRCRGLMVKDHFVDLEESYGRPWITGWRCVTCGNIVDPLIQRRRIRQAARAELAAEGGADPAQPNSKPVTA